MGNGWWKNGLFLGAGILLGAVGVMLISRNSAEVRRGAAKVLSHVVDIKDRAGEAVATAKENLDDLVAEARHESENRKGGA